MNMEEFRKGLESEARTENEKLKKQIKKLETEQSEEVQRLHHDLRALSNRCFALTRGTMCAFCRMMSKFECECSLGRDKEQ
jgi:DNA anti-recombination protein RmuC